MQSKALNLTVFSAAFVGVDAKVVGNSVQPMQLLLLAGRTDELFRKELVATGKVQLLIGFMMQSNYSTDQRQRMLITCVPSS